MAEDNKPKNFQEKLEQNIFGLFLFTALLVSIAGIVEIVPLFYLKSAVDYTEKTDQYGNAKNEKFPELVWERTFTQDDNGKLVSEKALYKFDKNGKPVMADWKAGDGVRPYTPLELAGRDLYIREGCYICHSQMIRPFRDERERYGHFSLATESMYDHPMQWGSKRTGPDLARLGGKYSDEWHILHLRRPQDLVPESVMPAYPWLDENMANVEGDQHVSFGKRDMQKRLSVMRTLGVPYTDWEIENADKAIEGYTEMDAMVAYLQVLGTMVKLDDSKVYRQ